MEPRVILNSKRFSLTLKRLAYQVFENYSDLDKTVIIGLQPRGIYLARRIASLLQDISGNKNIGVGELDVTFYRDDFRRREDILQASQTKMDFLIEDKNVILIDDVLYTGRTIRAGLDALMDFGRPQNVELLVLIDRRYSRQLPIQPNHIGLEIDSLTSERVRVDWTEKGEEKGVVLYKPEEER